MTVSHSKWLMSKLIDSPLEEFNLNVFNAAPKTLMRMQNLLKRGYLEAKLAHADLSARINEKDEYTEKEKELFYDLSNLMVKIENRSSIIISRLKSLGYALDSI